MGSYNYEEATYEEATITTPPLDGHYGVLMIF